VLTNYTCKYVLGEDREVYENLIAALPKGLNNLKRGIIVPAHPEDKPPTFEFGNLVAGANYKLDILGEWNTAPRPRKYFRARSASHLVTVPLPYGPVTLTLYDEDNGYVRFLVSVVNYATFFKAHAREITEYSKQPLAELENSISNDLAYRLATPLLAGLTNYIPADLEVLASLAHKLLVKNLLHSPGTRGATSEILAAFSASNPEFIKMQNISKLDSPLYRSEEMFQGHEGHVWLPNREIERWKAFILLINNLPQIYSLKQITEQEVHVDYGGKISQHVFDFNSPLANSITSGLTYLTDCFLKLFKLSVTVEAQHSLAFCQASYILDQYMTHPLQQTDADPLSVKPFQEFSLSGRFEQQYDISDTHAWIYDTPLLGSIDGVNRFFSLTGTPATSSAVKVFVDGLLKGLYRDYRINIDSNYIAGSFSLTSTLNPILLPIDISQPRPYKSPIFSTLQVRGDADLQMVITPVEQGLDTLSFVISHPPTHIVGDAEEISLQYYTPLEPATGIMGDDQYGIIDLPIGINSYDLVFPNPTSSSDYQLLISISVDPMPAGDPSLVSQLSHMVVNRSVTGATVQFSAATSEDMKLNWMVVEAANSTAIERGTQLLVEGQEATQIIFTGGPYVDIPVVLIQLWSTEPSPPTNVPIYLSSCMKVGPGGVLIRFSGPLSLSGYRLDYCVFSAGGAGDFIEFFTPPIGLPEAHYDTKWPYWANVQLTPQPDGIRRDFTLPYPCPDSNALYLTLNGRLMTQGANRQYITDGNTVTFTFPPAPTQVIWASYPRAATGEDTLPSSWSQDFLTRLPNREGEYATGKITLGGALSVGDKVHFGQSISFTAKDTASGLITHGGLINAGISILWTTLGVTLTSTPNVPTDIAAKGTITVVDFNSLVGASITVGSTTITEGVEWLALISNEYTAQLIASAVLSSISGITATVFENQVTVTSEIAGTLGNTIVLSSSDPTNLVISNPTLSGGVDAENRFQVGISKEADSISLLETINNHSILSLHYKAILIESGIISQRALALGDGVYNEPIIVLGSSLIATDITGDSNPSNYHECTVYHNEHVIGLPYSDVDLGTSSILNNSDMVYEGLAVKLTPVNTTIDIKDWNLLSGAILTLGGTSLVEGSEWSASVGDDETALSLANAIIAENLGLEVTTDGSLIILRAISYTLPMSVASNTPNLVIFNPYISILPEPLDIHTTYYVVNWTEGAFQLSLTQGGVPMSLTTLGTGYYRLSSQDVDIATSTFYFPTESVELLSTLVYGYRVIEVPSTELLSIGMTVSGLGVSTGSVIQTIDSETQITLNRPVLSTGDEIVEYRKIFQENEPIVIISNELPMGIVENQVYYAVYVQANSFQISELPNGTPFVFSDVGGEIKFYSRPQFPASVTKELDTLSLYNEIIRHPITNNILRAELIDNGIVVTAKEVGQKWMLPLSTNSSLITVTGMYSGEDKTTEIIYSTSKVCYRYDAPVVTLDGLSNRQWDHFNGDRFIFEYSPTLKQESYYVSEVFPVEQHPLDSTVANLPCNYPKGCFTQGLGAHINETEITVAHTFDNSLIISTANIPIQETLQPTGDPAVYTMSLTSCAGSASIMLWVGGIYQPPSEYVYTDMGGYGQITFNNEITPEQPIWIWYLPYGSACVDERTNILTGVIDDINVVYQVPDSPWANTPALMVFLGGLFMLQDQDYFVSTNTQIEFVIPPSTVPNPQTLWGHYNLGSIVPLDIWRQVHVGVTDGIEEIFMIPHLLSSELPLTGATVLVFLDGLNQGGQYTMETDVLGNLTGNIMFTGGAPEANRRLDVAYIRK
jgi:hypothetical protein